MLKRCAKWVLIAGAVGYVVGNFSAAILTWYLPKLYESEAVIHISPPKRSIEKNSETDFVSKDAFLKTQLSKISCPDAIRLGYEIFETQRPDYDSLGTTVDTIGNGLKCKIIEQTGNISVKLRLRSKFAARDALVSLIEAYSIRAPKVADENKEEYSQTMKKRDEISHRISEILNDLNLQPRFQYLGDEYFEQEINSALKIQKVIMASQLMECRGLWKQYVDLGLKIEGLLDAPEIICIKQPTISERPSSPNVSLNLNIGRIAGTLVFAGIALIWQVVFHQRWKTVTE